MMSGTSNEVIAAPYPANTGAVCVIVPLEVFTVIVTLLMLELLGVTNTWTCPA